MSAEAFKFLSDFINQGRYVNCAVQNHEIWLETKKEQGWTYGLVRDNSKKTNPLMRPFTDLPADIKGQNCLTPYAVVNFFRVHAGEKSLAELDALLAEILDQEPHALVDQLAEYVHSHFISGQLTQGEMVNTRNDLIIYEDLDDDTKSWDIHLALEAVKFLRRELSK